MISYFAAVFPDFKSADDAQRFVEKCHEDGLVNLSASVVIEMGEDGTISKHNGRTPGPLGAVLAGLVGGVLGVVGGPAVAAIGVAAGALSGGWFDLLRVQDREVFMNQIASRLSAGNAALLGEAIDPTEEAKRAVEARVRASGGTIIGKSNDGA